MARLLVTLGILLVLAGIVLYLFPRALSWFGSLPGDVNVERGNTRIFVPITSAIVLSIVLTLVINLAGWVVRFFR